MEHPKEGFVSPVRGSHTLRLVLAGLLVLLLQAPIAMIGSLVSERQGRRQSAVEEVSAKWGRSQTLTGPALVIPYTYHWTEVGANKRTVVRSGVRQAVFLPDRLAVKGKVDTVLRHRGIFSIPVYRLGLKVEGTFARPDFAEMGIDPSAANWRRAQLVVGITDTRAIAERTTASWGGRPVGFLPDEGQFAEADAGIHAVVSVDPKAGQTAFTFPLALNGSAGLYFVPFARQTVVDLESNWPSPSFQGNWLPVQRETSPGGCHARWSIPFLGRNYPQQWTSLDDMRARVDASRFGLDLLDPVDNYRMAQRSVKYAALFLVLTFAAVWLIEVLAGLRVHPLQYLLLGAALSLFYLLELSLSEHLGFTAAYALASVAVVVMVGAYSLSVLRSRSKAAFVAVGVAGLYGYLHVLLRNEDYALLIGSLGLFLILAAVMFVTRRIDWYALDVLGPASRDGRG